MLDRFEQMQRPRYLARTSIKCRIIVKLEKKRRNCFQSQRGSGKGAKIRLAVVQKKRDNAVT